MNLFHNRQLLHIKPNNDQNVLEQNIGKKWEDKITEDHIENSGSNVRQITSYSGHKYYKHEECEEKPCEFKQCAIEINGTNGSTQGLFILVGFSNFPNVKRVILVVLLVAHLLTLLGHTPSSWCHSWTPPPHARVLLTPFVLPGPQLHPQLHPQLLHKLRVHDKIISSAGAQSSSSCSWAWVEWRDYCWLSRPMTVTLWLHCCAHKKKDHFLCEMPILIRVACVSMVAIEGTVLVLDNAVVLRKTQSSTPVAHLTLGSLSYGNIIFKYMQPGAAPPGTRARSSCSSTTPSPPPEPLICTLRNRELSAPLQGWSSGCLTKASAVGFIAAQGLSPTPGCADLTLQAGTRATLAAAPGAATAPCRLVPTVIGCPEGGKEGSTGDEPRGPSADQVLKSFTLELNALQTGETSQSGS
ncbi:hypothetical protein GHT09_013393 [Marmota monax]|uniref:Uncharacterized protein n=1 Tax=Marmota monax TaxID=9995 RepID=A0A834PM92_MARMO|nr:hypothetical protein GHT09_013393 [Marmota monax]